MAKISTNASAIRAISESNNRAVAVRRSSVVKEVQIDDSKIGPIEAVYLSPRVLSQTPKAGTQVVRGAVVNVVFGNGRNVLADVVVGAAQQFKGRPLGIIYDEIVKDDLTVSALMEKYADAGKLTESEHAQFRTSLAAKGVQVGEDVDGVMSVLGAAQTFNAEAD
jgi:beta-lactam-binding protein with PASTA domain